MYGQNMRNTSNWELPRYRFKNHSLSNFLNGVVKMESSKQ
jgi:hypothetical protein